MGTSTRQVMDRRLRPDPSGRSEARDSDHALNPIGESGNVAVKAGSHVTPVAGTTIHGPPRAEPAVSRPLVLNAIR